MTDELDRMPTMHAGVELDLYELPPEPSLPLEWPDTTRLELSTADGIALFWRDDAHAVGEGRWWFTGIPRCALTWVELWEAYGQQLEAAIPLYPPSNTAVAVRPVHVLVSWTAGQATHVWCFTDSDDARAAYDLGVGQSIMPSVLLAPGVALEPVVFATGWARIGRNPADDATPRITHSTHSWAAPGVHIPMQRSGDDLDGLSTLGQDVFDLFCVGTDIDSVLADLAARFSELDAARLGAITWAPAGTLM